MQSESFCLFVPINDTTRTHSQFTKQPSLKQEFHQLLYDNPAIKQCLVTDVWTLICDYAMGLTLVMTHAQTLSLNPSLAVSPPMTRINGFGQEWFCIDNELYYRYIPREERFKNGGTRNSHLYKIQWNPSTRLFETATCVTQSAATGYVQCHSANNDVSQPFVHASIYLVPGSFVIPQQQRKIWNILLYDYVRGRATDCVNLVALPRYNHSTHTKASHKPLPQYTILTEKSGVIRQVLVGRSHSYINMYYRGSFTYKIRILVHGSEQTKIVAIPPIDMPANYYLVCELSPGVVCVNFDGIISIMHLQYFFEMQRGTARIQRLPWICKPQHYILDAAMFQGYLVALNYDSTVFVMSPTDGSLLHAQSGMALKSQTDAPYSTVIEKQYQVNDIPYPSRYPKQGRSDSENDLTSDSDMDQSFAFRDDTYFIPSSYQIYNRNLMYLMPCGDRLFLISPIYPNYKHNIRTMRYDISQWTFQHLFHPSIPYDTRCWFYDKCESRRGEIGPYCDHCWKQTPSPKVCDSCQTRPCSLDLDTAGIFYKQCVVCRYQ